MPTTLITGANRGLGLEFARQYAGDGWQVIACCREPDQATDLQAVASGRPGAVEVQALDVTDGASVTALARRLAGRPIDLLVNNAGRGQRGGDTLGSIDTVVLFSPGWVRTDMGGPNAPLSAEESIASLRKTIAGLSLEQSGRFLNHDGTEISW